MRVNVLISQQQNQGFLKFYFQITGMLLTRPSSIFKRIENSRRGHIFCLLNMHINSIFYFALMKKYKN